MTAPRSIGDLFTRVARRIENQSFLPVSPGTFADGKPLFCAGAAYIYEAAQELVSSAAANNLAEELVTRGTNGLRLTARALNLDERIVDGLISANDSFSDDERRTAMREAVLKLAAESRSDLRVCLADDT
jgi:hypothetical protein